MRSLSVEVVERDYAKQPLTRAEVRRIVKAVGSVAEVLNTRHKVAKERDWKAAPPSVGDFAAAVVDEPNLLRRPILVSGDRGVVGKQPEPMRELLGA